MRAMLLGFAAAAAAIAIAPSPAQAQSFEGRIHRSDDFVGISGETGRFQGCDVISRRGHRDGEVRRGRRGRGGDCSISVGTWVNGGEWALYNNRTFESDSYNDWWHDRPDRSYPRWVSTNQNCERMWWSGSGWRC